MRQLQQSMKILVMLLISTTAFSQEMSIVYVDISLIVDQIPQTQQIKEELKNEFSSLDYELTQKQQAITELENNLSVNASSLREAEKRKLEREVQIRKRDFERERNNFIDKVSLRRTEETEKLKESIRQLINTIAVENSYSMVMESNVIYAADELNISQIVIERMNEIYDTANSETDSIKEIIEE
jgi:outer membrane protein